MNIFTFLILLSIILFIVSFLYAIYEINSALLMKEWVYKIGWVIVKVTEPFAFSPGWIVQRERGETEKCEYRFVSPRCCVFRERFSPIDILKKVVNPIKGRVTFEDGMAELEGRIPLGSLGASAAIILGTLAVGLKVVLTGGGAASAWIFGAVVLAAAGSYLIILSNQKGRLLIAYEELKNRVVQLQKDTPA